MNRCADPDKSGLHLAALIKEICVIAQRQPACFLLAGFGVHIIFCPAVGKPSLNRLIVAVIILRVSVTYDPSVIRVSSASLRRRIIVSAKCPIIKVQGRRLVVILRHNAPELIRVSRIIEINSPRNIIALEFLCDHIVIDAVRNIPVIAHTRHISEPLRVLRRPV